MYTEFITKSIKKVLINLRIEEAILLDTLCCRLNFLRSQHDYSKEFIATQLKVSVEEYSTYEKGDFLPSITELVEISILYQVSLDYLVGRTEESVL